MPALHRGGWVWGGAFEPRGGIRAPDHSGVHGVLCVSAALSLARSAGMGNKSKYMIGDGTNLVDFTYVENVAYAHLLAAVKLAPSAKIHGQV